MKELNTKATNEITIRQALSELDVWEFETHFSTINYVDSKGHTIRIINDFKTIFSSVRQMFLHKKNSIRSLKHAFCNSINMMKKYNIYIFIKYLSCYTEILFFHVWIDWRETMFITVN